MVKCREMI